MKKGLFLILALFALVSLAFFNINKVEAKTTVSLSLAASCTDCKLYGDKTVSVTANIDIQNGVIGAIDTTLNYDQTKLKYKSIVFYDTFDDVLGKEIHEDIGTIGMSLGKTGGQSVGGRLFKVDFEMLQVTNGEISTHLSPTSVADANGRVDSTSSPVKITISAYTPPATPDPVVTDPVVTPASETPASPTNKETPTTSSSTKTNSPTAKQPAKATPVAVVFDPTKSQVTFSKIEASADGSDEICIDAKIVGSDGKVFDKKPEIVTDGDVAQGDIKITGDTWHSCLASKIVGAKKVEVKVDGVILDSKEVNFTMVAVATDQVPGRPSLSDIYGNVSTQNKKIVSSREITVYDQLVIEGTGMPGELLNVYIHSDVIKKQVTIGADGKWKVLIDSPLESGSHRVEVAIVDKAGAESETKLIAQFEVKKNLPIDWIVLGSALLLVLAGLLVFVLFHIYKKRNIVEKIGLNTRPANYSAESKPVVHEHIGFHDQVKLADDTPNFEDEYSKHFSSGDSSEVPSMTIESRSVPPEDEQVEEKNIIVSDGFSLPETREKPSNLDDDRESFQNAKSPAEYSTIPGMREFSEDDFVKPADPVVDPSSVNNGRFDNFIVKPPVAGSSNANSQPQSPPNSSDNRP